MRSIAWGFLAVILLLILIMPLVDLANVMREKIMLGSALTNASRAAENLSLQYDDHRNLDAVLNEIEFVRHFAESLEKALDLTTIHASGMTVKFRSNSGLFNDITVTLDFNTRTGADNRMITEVRMQARTDYKFKTKLLQAAEQATGFKYEMLSERLLLVQIRN